MDGGFGFPVVASANVRVTSNGVVVSTFLHAVITWWSSAPESVNEIDVSGVAVIILYDAL